MHVGLVGVRYIEGSEGILPQEILNTRTPKTPFLAIWVLKMS